MCLNFLSERFWNIAMFVSSCLFSLFFLFSLLHHSILTMWKLLFERPASAFVACIFFFSPLLHSSGNTSFYLLPAIISLDCVLFGHGFEPNL